MLQKPPHFLHLSLHTDAAVLDDEEEAKEALRVDNEVRSEGTNLIYDALNQ